jgi:hypothetical protein
LGLTGLQVNIPSFLLELRLPRKALAQWLAVRIFSFYELSSSIEYWHSYLKLHYYEDRYFSEQRHFAKRAGDKCLVWRNSPSIQQWCVSVFSTNRTALVLILACRITWGALAKELYAPHTRYGIVPLSIIIGLFVPIPFWIMHKKFPGWHFDKIITPMLTNDIGYFSTGITSATFCTFLLLNQSVLAEEVSSWLV